MVDRDADKASPPRMRGSWRRRRDWDSPDDECTRWYARPLGRAARCCRSNASFCAEGRLSALLKAERNVVAGAGWPPSNGSRVTAGPCAASLAAYCGHGGVNASSPRRVVSG